MAESFEVDKDLYLSEKTAKNQEDTEFVLSCLQNTSSEDVLVLPSWAGIKTLLSEAEVPLMHVGFVPFIPNPVTDPSTVYTAMVNFLNIFEQLDQDALPVFCDEGVFRIVADIYLQRPEQFKSLIPMLGGFHTAKCVEHCVGKYISDSGIEDVLKQTKVLGVKVTESVLNGTNYVRSLKVILILANSFGRLKWKPFLEPFQRSKKGSGGIIGQTK